MRARGPEVAAAGPQRNFPQLEMRRNEDRADPVRQGRDQLRGLPVLAPRAADGLAVDRDHQPTAGPHSPRPQPGTQHPVENIGAGQGERAAEGRLLRRPGRQYTGTAGRIGHAKCVFPVGRRCEPKPA
jgi:hypothetical protein